MEQIRVTLDDGRTVRFAVYTTVGTIFRRCGIRKGLPCLGALVNNEVSSLSYPLTTDSKLSFLTAADSHGIRIYRNSISFILAKAVSELFPAAQFSVEHSFGTGLYCSFEAHRGKVADKRTGRKQVAEIERRMRQIVKQNLPIRRRKLSFEQAAEQFRRTGQYDKLNLLRFRNPPRIVIHTCGGFSDLGHSPLAQGTGALGVFRLVHYRSGFVLQLPDREAPACVAPFIDQPQLFHILQEHKDWGRILNVTTVGRLNEIIAGGEISEFIRVAEALHEKKTAAIADQIVARRCRVILVAGPSSAGKTTFSKRLAVQLRVNGLRPRTISTDDYFFDEAHTPRDEEGKLDFEHIKAVDVVLFNQHLVKLLRGEEIEQIQFDFEKKQRRLSGTRLHLEDDELLIVEGIHGLNPRLTYMVPAGQKFRIYVSALTQLAIDSNNRISTTDNRLMRRMVRDKRFRGNSPLATLRMWPSVRKGEKTWVFPFQRQADVAFNSALDYELAVLKPLVEPLLLEIKPSDAEYAEARRLSAFLSNFLAVSDFEVPRTSILREYIGRSGFRY